MNKQTIQELLPPLHSPDGESSWFDWLTSPTPKRFMLPATGLLIMGLDWMLFSEEAVSLGLLIPLTAPMGFVLGAVGTYRLQTRQGQDSKPVATLKALLAGFLVAIPLPLAGTMIGGAILASSGLAGLKWRLLKNRFSRRPVTANAN
jgi:hypothetical protein